MSDIRDKLRSSILNQKKNKKTKIIELFGQDVEVRQPTLDQINRLTSSESDVPVIVRILVEYCFVPGTDEPVFDASDKDEILQLPTGPWLENFNKAVEELTGIRVEEAEKN